MTERPVFDADRLDLKDFPAAGMARDVRNAGVVLPRNGHGYDDGRRGDEEGYRPAADLEGPSRVSREGLLYGGNTQHRQRRRHHHQRRAECGSRREGRRRENKEVIEKRHCDEASRVPHFRICVPQVFRFHISVQFLYRRFVKAELFFRLEVDQEDARPVDCHFFKAFHDVADLVDRLGFRFSQRLQYIVDDTIADAVAQESSREVGDGHEQDERRRDPLPCGESALSFRKGLSFFCQPFFFQDPPHEEKEKNDRDEVEDHFPVSRKLVSNVNEEAFVVFLLAVSRPVARRGKEQEESDEHADGSAHHPGGERSFSPGVPHGAPREEHGGHSEVFHRPAAEDARKEHGQGHASAPMQFPCRPQVIGQEEEEHEEARPEVDRGAAFPYGHFAEVGQGEPHKERRQREDARLGGELRIPCGMEIEEDEHAREDRRVGDVEGEFPDPQEEVEEKDRHRPSAVSHVMIFQRLEHIAKRRNMLRRPPDQGIIKIIAPDREQNIQEHHEKEDARKEQKGLPAVFLSRHHHRPSLSPAAPPGPASLHTSFFCRSSRPPGRADGVCSH